MPIPKEQFQTISAEGSTLLDLSPETTQGTVYRFLLANAEQAFRQRELIDALDVPEGSVGPTLTRLEKHGLLEHRDRFWAVSDAEHAVAAAARHTAVTADDIDGGFSDDDVEVWMASAVDPVGAEDGTGDADDTADERA